MAASFAPKEHIYTQKAESNPFIHQGLYGSIGERLHDLLHDPDNAQYFNTKYIFRLLSKSRLNKEDAFHLWIIFNFLNWKNLVLKDEKTIQI